MADGPLALLVERNRLAAELRRLRQAAGLSTYALADLIGVSQSKVFKMETGRTAARPADVEAWARATGSSSGEIGRLVERAERARTEAVAWRGAMGQGLPRLQEEVAALEQVATTIRMYHPVLVPGHLMTAEYARRLYVAQYTDDRPDIGAAVAAWMERQTILYDESKRFEFVLTEAALRWSIAPRPVQLAQLDRIRQVLTLPNVNLGILPLGIALPVWHSHGFTIYEDRNDDGDPSVHVETLTASLSVSDPADVETYRRTFASLRSAAVVEEAATAIVGQVAAQLVD